MDPGEKISKAAAFGQRAAFALKPFLAAERRLITRYGRHGSAVKLGIILVNFVVIAGLATVSIWISMILIPFLLLYAVFSQGGGIEYPNSDGYGADGKYHAEFDED